MRDVACVLCAHTKADTKKTSQNRSQRRASQHPGHANRIQPRRHHGPDDEATPARLSARLQMGEAPGAHEVGSRSRPIRVVGVGEESTTEEAQEKQRGDKRRGGGGRVRGSSTLRAVTYHCRKEHAKKRSASIDVSCCPQAPGASGTGACCMLCLWVRTIVKVADVTNDGVVLHLLHAADATQHKTQLESATRAAVARMSAVGSRFGRCSTRCRVADAAAVAGAVKAVWLWLSLLLSLSRTTHTETDTAQS